MIDDGNYLVTCQQYLGEFFVTIGERLRHERERLGFTQPVFAALAETTKKSQIDYEKDLTQPKAGYLAAISKVGADIQFVITGERQGHGIGESAVHQAVLDAVDLLSLDKAINAQQLARAVLKLAAKSKDLSPDGGGASQAFNGPVTGGVAGRDIVNNR